MLSSNRRLGGLVLAVVLIPSSLPAQTIARSFDELQGMLTADELVIVIDRTGQATKGRVAEISAASLVLVTPKTTQRGLDIWDPGARRTFARNNVAQILRSDPTGTTGARMYLAPPPQSFQDLQRTLKRSETVVVTEASGRKTKGKVMDVRASSLMLSVDGKAREFPEHGVTRIDRRGDQLRNGTLIGMTIGAVIPAAMIVRECSQEGCTEKGDAASVALMLGLSGTFIGAVVGAGIDAMFVGQTTVYLSPRKMSGVTISPLLGKDRLGALVSVGF